MFVSLWYFVFNIAPHVELLFRYAFIELNLFNLALYLVPKHNFDAKNWNFFAQVHLPVSSFCWITPLVYAIVRRPCNMYKWHGEIVCNVKPHYIRCIQNTARLDPLRYWNYLYCRLWICDLYLSFCRTFITTTKYPLNNDNKIMTGTILCNTYFT